MKTWHAEHGVVALVLAGVAIASGARPVDWVAAAAVLASFGHASISDRLAEREAAREVPTVECHAKLLWYYVAKELGWAVVFVMTGAWPALAGCAVLGSYPIWRRWYRRRRPFDREST